MNLKQDLITVLPYWNKDGHLSRNDIMNILKTSESYARLVYGILENTDDIKSFLLSTTKLEGDLNISKEETKDGITISSPISSTIDELMDKFEIDKNYWDITKSVINEWGSMDNYNRQAKAWLSRKGDIIDWDKFKSEFIEDVKKVSPPVPLIKNKEVKTGKLLEISIYDLHLGKLAWAMESGTNYDSKIAANRFNTAIEELLSYALSHKVERILFPVGNDFFNSDKDLPYPATTAGTPQESDLRWQKVFRNGRVLLISAIDRLKAIAPVDIIVIPGNHDHQKMFYLGDLLEVKYENDKNVMVNNSPAPRKYYRYGKCMIGFAHGRPSDTPVNRLLQLMPQEEPQMWAKTKFREWHLGDVHHKRTFQTKSEEDMGGIMIRHFRTLKGQDAWEAGKGYFSMGGAEAMVWDKENGKVANYYYNL